jgi:hypothetical protein
MPELALIYITISSVVLAIVSAIQIFLIFWIGKKFGGLYKKFFFLFGIAWIFMTLHRIDETLLVFALPSVLPPEALMMSYSQIVSKFGPSPSPILMMFRIPADFLIVKIGFLLIFALVIGFALYLHYKITAGKWK